MSEVENTVDVNTGSEEDEDLQKFLKDALSVEMESVWVKVRQVTVARANKRQEQKLAEQMGNVHNAIVALLSESKLPITHINLVLDFVKASALEQAKKFYVGEQS